MTIRLTPDQEALVHDAIAKGLAPSPEDVVTIALRTMRDEFEHDLEARLGMDTPTINRELQRGLDSPATPWEGATSFNKRMLKKHRDALSGNSQER